MESRARADGVMTRNERARIDGMQDHLGRDIRRESHDRQTANSNGHRPYGWDRGNGNGWGRGNDHGRGHDFGRNNDHRQFGNRDGGRGEHNYTHGGSTTPRAGTGNGWTPRTGSTTPRTDTTPPRAGTQPRADRSERADRTDRSSGRQASMPQAQARSTPNRENRTVAVARQGGDSGRRTR